MLHLSKFPRFPELFTNKTMLNQFCDKCSACKCTNECLQIQLRQRCNVGRHWCICINLGDQPRNLPDMHDLKVCWTVTQRRLGDRNQRPCNAVHEHATLEAFVGEPSEKCNHKRFKTFSWNSCWQTLSSLSVESKPLCHFACLEPKGQHGYWRLCHFLDKNYTFAHPNFLLLFLCVPQSKEYYDPKPHQRWYVH